MGLLTSIPNNVLTSLLTYFKSRYQPRFDASNTATGVTSVTLNTTSGVAVFTEVCETAPSWTDYIINNSLVTTASIVRVSVQSTAQSTITLYLSSATSLGAIIVSINDGGSGSPAAPIVMFEILN